MNINEIGAKTCLHKNAYRKETFPKEKVSFLCIEKGQIRE